MIIFHGTCVCVCANIEVYIYRVRSARTRHTREHNSLLFNKCQPSAGNLRLSFVHIQRQLNINNNKPAFRMNLSQTIIENNRIHQRYCVERQLFVCLLFRIIIHMPISTHMYVRIVVPEDWIYTSMCVCVCWLLQSDAWWIDNVQC